MRSILTALQEGRLFELPDNTKTRALEFLARILDANPEIEVGTDTIEEIQHREEECNTGIGLGIGVPHVRARREEGDIFCAIGWSAQGIDYGSTDNKPVHLVVMYYIPGAQKNVYLKEISSLVKAIRKTGGIDPVAHATDLGTVRNLLLDWFSALAGEGGPEAVARMIRLEVKQAHALPVNILASGASSPLGISPIIQSATTAAQTLPCSKAVAFSILLVPGAVYVLAQECELATALEKTEGLLHGLHTGSFTLSSGQQAYVLSSTTYANGRILYSCTALQT